MTPPNCHDCGDRSRREFLKTGALAVAAATLPGLAHAKAAPKSETLVTTLYRSLDEAQRGTLCFPFDHALRSKVDNN